MNAPRLILAFLAALLAGCDSTEADAPPCHSAMPTPREILEQPAFATLTFRNHVYYDATRGVGYNVWADSRYEFNAALQWSFVPSTTGRAGSQFCSVDMALRLAVPLDGRRRDMLDAFARSMSRRTGLDAGKLEARLSELAASGAKYGRIEERSGVIVEAGLVSSSVRGDFFAVAFNWPPPAR